MTNLLFKSRRVILTSDDIRFMLSSRSFEKSRIWMWVSFFLTHIPRVHIWVPFAGDSLRGLIYFTTDRPHYTRMPPLSGDNHGWVVSAVRTGCALGHRATTIRACAHLMKTAARYQLWAQGRSFVPGPNKFGGITGRSPGERPHYGIAGESPGKRDLMWTQGLYCMCTTNL